MIPHLLRLLFNKSLLSYQSIGARLVKQLTRLVEFICKEIYIYIYIFQNSNIWFCFICQLFNSQRMFFPCVKTDPKICIRVSKITKKRTWKRNRWHKATFYKAGISRSSSFTARQRFTEEPAISGLFGDRSHPGT